MNSAFKKSIQEAFAVRYKQERDELIKSAQKTHEAATHEEAKAEDSHDTRAIEASYLAQGQMERVAQIQKLIIEIERMPTEATSLQVIAGSLVQIEDEETKHRAWYLVTTQAGGGVVQVQGTKVTLLSTQSPMGQNLLGLRVGEGFENEIQSKSFRMISLL
jgi:transcription elongation GreA/GreB family factor